MMKQYTVFFIDQDGAIRSRALEAETPEDAIEALCHDVFGGGCSLIGAVEGDVLMTTGSDEEGSGIISCDDYPGADPEDDCCVSGYHFPTTLDGDASRQWVTRCDECEIFESDEEAAKYAANALGLKAEEHDNPNKDYAAKAWSLEEV